MKAKAKLKTLKVEDTDNEVGEWWRTCSGLKGFGAGVRDLGEEAVKCRVGQLDSILDWA